MNTAARRLGGALAAVVAVGSIAVAPAGAARNTVHSVSIGGPSSVDSGESTTYTITVTNSGPAQSDRTMELHVATTAGTVTSLTQSASTPSHTWRCSGAGPCLTPLGADGAPTGMPAGPSTATFKAVVQAPSTTSDSSMTVSATLLHRQSEGDAWSTKTDSKTTSVTGTGGGGGGGGTSYGSDQEGDHVVTEECDAGSDCTVENPTAGETIRVLFPNVTETFTYSLDSSAASICAGLPCLGQTAGLGTLPPGYTADNPIVVTFVGRVGQPFILKSNATSGPGTRMDSCLLASAPCFEIDGLNTVVKLTSIDPRVGMFGL